MSTVKKIQEDIRDGIKKHNKTIAECAKEIKRLRLMLRAAQPELVRLAETEKIEKPVAVPRTIRKSYKKKRKHNAKTTSPCITVNSRRKILQKPSGRKRIRNFYGNRQACSLMKLQFFPYVKLISNLQDDSYNKRKIYKRVTVFPMTKEAALSNTHLRENEIICKVHLEAHSGGVRFLCSKYIKKYMLDIINSHILENGRHKLIESIPGVSYTFEINNSGSVA